MSENETRTAQAAASQAVIEVPDNAVPAVGYRDATALLTPPSERRQSMRGFDAEYSDIVDYIIRCTHKIWEEKAVGLIYSHYRQGAVVYTPFGVVHSAEAVVAETLKVLNAFPDRRLHGEAVIWSGDDQRGYYSSHRILNTATNTGPSMFGPATGRRIIWRGIADCVVYENRVCEEWLVRDGMQMCRQLGFEPHEVARAMARADRAKGIEPFPVGEVSRAPGQHAPTSWPVADQNDLAAVVAAAWNEIWNRRMLNTVRTLYSDTAVQHGPAGRELYGHDGLIGFFLSTLAAFPDARFTVDHRIHNCDADHGDAVALRWTLSGSHEGAGRFGPPSGQRVSIMGISHFRLVEGRVVEEWTLFDELAVLKQIYHGLADGAETARAP